jgi:spore photoproduct lyase
MAIGRSRGVTVEQGSGSAPLTEEILGILGAEAGGPSGSARACLPARLTLRTQKGRFLKRCPGTRNYLCCGYHVLNVMEGCPLGCTYCVLQGYLEHEEVVVFVNLEDALRELTESLTNWDGVARVGTGELADSLALDPWVPLSEKLVPVFRDLPRGVLELKTKSIHVERLLELPHGGHTVVSWSLNPPSLARRAEPLAPSPIERLEAARRCQERGYPIGLHFDPMVWYPGWEEEYRGLVEQVFRFLDPQGIIWISLGALRYPPALHERLLPSGLALGESFPGLDGKLRYLRPLRTSMFRSMARWLREMGGDVFVYLCMESPQVWDGALGWVPADMSELDRRFQARIVDFWTNH